MAQRAEPTQGERTAHQVEIAEKSQRLSRWRRPKERWRLREWGSCFSKPGVALETMVGATCRLAIASSWGRPWSKEGNGKTSHF